MDFHKEPRGARYPGEKSPMAFDFFRKTPVHTAIVVDEFGALQGLVIRTDLLETVAGDLPKIDARALPRCDAPRQDK